MNIGTVYIKIVLDFIYRARKIDVKVFNLNRVITS